MTLDGEHARRVVKLFANVFADALERAASLTVAVVRFVMDQRARKLWWQWTALRLLTHLGLDGCGLQRLKLRFNRGDIGVDQVVEQAGLIGINAVCSVRFFCASG